MKAIVASALLGALSAVSVQAAPVVDEVYPYTGPAIPIGDWVDPTVNGNGKGFPRLVEPPAVKPAKANPTNNINVISLSYVPNGINIHYQTPFGLGVAPSVSWGTSATNLNQQASGSSHTYDRTPPCSMISAVTQCSQFFHEVQIGNLQSGTKYYYQIPAANGTTASNVLSFTTARAAGDSGEFSIAVLNDMGYTNAAGTFKQILNAVDDGAAFAWHGGDISYADDWYSGILPCADDWPVCYNGTSSALPGGVIDDADYNTPLPAGELPNQGGPLGGDMSVLYESNWDLWQQWTNTLTTQVPYMVLPGNHEAACSEFDGPNNIMTAYLDGDKSNSSSPTSNLTYYSCPPSQRNFTAYQNRFRMPGAETGGVSNFWYSFDYGLAHFVSIDAETDFANSPEKTFLADLTGTETHPTESETYVTNSGPFGAIDGGKFKDNTAYAQYKWLAADLASVDRTKTPWIIINGHRPMYSSGISSYQANLRAAFQALMLKYGVDVYYAGHIHWYERLFPLTVNGTVDKPSVIDNHTYYTNEGVSMAHIVNGMAGNIESHSELTKGVLNITAVLDTKHYGFSKLTVYNATALKIQFILGEDGSVGDELVLLKPTKSGSTNSTSSGTSTSSVPYTTSTVYKTVTSTISSCAPTVTSCPYTTAPITVTDTVVDYTTYCPVSAATIAPSSSVPYTTSTVYKTITSTISSCPATVISCPYTTAPIVVTSTVVDYTTYCPVSSASASTPVSTGAAKVSVISGPPIISASAASTSAAKTVAGSAGAASTPAGSGTAGSTPAGFASAASASKAPANTTTGATSPKFTGGASRVSAASLASFVCLFGFIAYIL